MKKIEKTDLPGMTLLTPVEMNSIHFESGRHSPVDKKETGTSSTSRQG